MSRHAAAVTNLASGLDVDIHVARGSFHLHVAFRCNGGVHVLFGPSGAGKSTTLQAIAGLLRPTKGRILLGSETLFARGLHGQEVDVPARARRAGYVFQDYALFPHLSAAENVAFSLRKATGASARAARQLERVGMSELADRFPHQLSGGQQQRVAIARALAAGPRVLLLDEPFAALDVETRRDVRAEIRRLLKETMLPVVLVTHDREEALALGDRVTVIGGGRVMATGEPSAVLRHPPQERVARLVGVENILKLRVQAVHSDEGVMLLSAGAFQLEVPLSQAEVDDEVTIGLRADDVMLAVRRPQGVSARNVLAGSVAAVELHGAAYLVEVDCAGVTLRSRVTRRSTYELGIGVGASVWAIVKTAACVVLSE